ncbi:MAG: TolC family protein [Acidobacteriota bacterium]
MSRLILSRIKKCSLRASGSKRPADRRWRTGVLVGLLGLGWLPGPGLARDSRVPGEDQGGRAVVLRLTLAEAIDLALQPDGNARVRLAAQMLRQAEAQSAVERASLVPNLDGSVSRQSRTTNLAAMGIQIRVPIPGFQTPGFVGPFDSFDARIRATQMIFDLSAIRRFQATRAGVREAHSQDDAAHEAVAAQVAEAYVNASRSDARWQTAQANVELSQALLELARNQKSAGTGTAIEVTRAEVQLANQRQQLLVTNTERRRAYLQLARVIGLELAVPLELAEPLSAASQVTLRSEDQLVQLALERRADMQAQKDREERLRLQVSSVKWERLPSVYAFGDYGSLGISPGNSLPTRAVGVSVNLPLFDGGRRDARRAEVLSRWEQERIRTQDLKEQIELEVRLARDHLVSAEQQVRVASEGVGLAQQELEQAERRYRGGVTTSIEVIDAQARLERARESRIAALYQYHLSRIELGRASGSVREPIQSLEVQEQRP